MANHPHNPSRPARKSVQDAVARGDITTVVRKLTARQRRFCEEYSIDFNGGAAAVRAGYSSKTATAQATNLMQNVGVLAYIDDLTRSKEAKIVSVDPDYIIRQVTEIIGKPFAKDSDRLRGLELLARHLGMFIERTELTGRDGGPLEINQKRVEEDAQNFTNLLNQLRERAERDKSEDAKVPGSNPR
jgi:phage terminase small subunit